MRSLVQLDDVRKTYRMGEVDVHALRGVTLSIADGEFIAIMGASGSGKSTLMNVIGCLDRPSGGSYHLAGEEVSRLGRDALAAVRNRTLGFVFQSFNLLSRTTALENVELPLLYKSGGPPAAERDKKARALLEAVGLGARAHHTPSQLSGGQQQRVAVARALVTDPGVLLADEPTGNLDSRTSVEIMEVLQRLNRERAITIVLITHEPDIAEYAERVITFRDGRVVSDAPVAKRREAAEEFAALPPLEVEA
jgi:putative ABC transport system ATP-binding protein